MQKTKQKFKFLFTDERIEKKNIEILENVIVYSHAMNVLKDTPYSSIITPLNVIAKQNNLRVEALKEGMKFKTSDYLELWDIMQVSIYLN